MRKVYRGKYVIVTGASLGLGKAIAENLASKGFNLILLSLPGENLPHCCDELSIHYGIETLFYETDLRDEDNIRSFADWALSQNVEISGLVNNAGIGGSSFFEQTDLSAIDNM